MNKIYVIYKFVRYENGMTTSSVKYITMNEDTAKSVLKSLNNTKEKNNPADVKYTVEYSIATYELNRYL